MSIRLFDLENGKVKPTVHCETIESLKKIKKEYPKDYMSIYAYLFYMSCYNEDENPFSNVPEADKEDLILREVGGDFSTDDDTVYKALEVTKKLYETPSYNFYISAKVGLERLAKYIRDSAITEGRDGNIREVRDTIKQFGDLNEVYNQLNRQFKEESKAATARGGSHLAYDQS